MSSIRPDIEFNIIDTYDLRVLRVEDTSNWQHLADEATYIDITTPGSQVPVTNYLEKNTINLFNSNLLDLTCSDCKNGLGKLPDGIYKIKIYACEGDKFFYERYYLRTVKTLLELDKILVDLGLHIACIDKTFMDTYKELELKLKAAHSLVREGYIKEGAVAYGQVVDEIEGLKGCAKKYKPKSQWSQSS